MRFVARESLWRQSLVYWFIALTALLIAVPQSSLSQEEADEAVGRDRTVVLDAGHGGKDDGASWYGVREKDLNLTVALRVAELLREEGVSVVLTRDDDTYVAINDRAAIANELPNSLFVSIHFNAHVDRTIQGIETFYRSPAGANVARALQTAIMDSVGGTRDRGIKKGPYAVLTRTKFTAVLVECGFISNRAENARCRTEAYQERVARAIASAISESL